MTTLSTLIAGLVAANNRYVDECANGTTVKAGLAILSVEQAERDLGAYCIVHADDVAERERLERAVVEATTGEQLLDAREALMRWLIDHTEDIRGTAHAEPQA